MKFFSFEKKNNPQEKHRIWDEKHALVDRIIDGLGKHVDRGIKETVTAFMVHDIPTNASCEGHLDHGLPYPWIDVPGSTPELEEKEQEIITLLQAGANGAENLEDLKSKNPSLWKKVSAFEDEEQAYRYKIRSKIDALLSEFYADRKTANTGLRIKIVDSPTEFHLEPTKGKKIGKENWEKFNAFFEQLTLEEKQSFLEENRKEMEAFTAFLKKKFFESEKH